MPRRPTQITWALLATAIVFALCAVVALHGPKLFWLPAAYALYGAMRLTKLAPHAWTRYRHLLAATQVDRALQVREPDGEVDGRLCELLPYDLLWTVDGEPCEWRRRG